MFKRIKNIIELSAVASLMIGVLAINKICDKIEYYYYRDHERAHKKYD